MFMGLGMPIPDLSNKPGPGRPGWSAGTYDFQFEVTGAVTIKAQPAATGTFTIKWPNGTEQTTAGSNSIPAPDSTAGIVSINKKTDTTYADEFAIVGGQTNVTKVISWGSNGWSDLTSAFQNCTNLTDISTTVFTSAIDAGLNYIFKGCTSLAEVNISNWNLTNGISIHEGFMNCTGLNSFTASSLNIKTLSARWLSNTGTATADGCDFKMSGLNITTANSYSSGQMIDWFKGCKINPSSNFSNWSFPSIPHAVMSFQSATITGTNSTLNCSGWTNYNSLGFPSFNSLNYLATSSPNMKINITGLNVSTVTTLYRAFNSCWASEIIGLSGLGATNSASGAEHFMYQTYYLKLNDNFSSAFMNSLAPTNLSVMFYGLGKNLSLADAGPAPNLHSLDLSSATNLGAIFQNTKFSTAPDFTNVTLSPTTVYNTGLMFQNIQVNDNSNVNSLFSKTFKMDSLAALFGGTNINSIIFGSNVDFSSVTTMSHAFSGTPNTTNIEFPTNANFSSLTTATSAFNAHTLSTCQIDNLIRAFYNTALTNAVTISFGSAKITESPAVVRGLLDDLENTGGWSITVNATDATLPFAYPSYSFDSEVTQSVTPTTVPSGSQFSSTDPGVTVDQNTGVVSWASTYMGLPVIRCTYADGCYNEVQMSMLITVDNNYSMAFDGTGSYMNVTSDPLKDGATNFSFSTWVKKDAAATSNHTILQSWQSPAWLLFRYANGTHLHLYFGGTTRLVDETLSSLGLNNNNWNHIAVVNDYDNSKLKIYVNGDLKYTRSSTQVAYQSNTSPLQIGGGTYPNYWNGEIDEVGIFNRALTDSQVKLIYDANSTNKSIKLSSLPGGAPVAWYRMGD